MSNIREKTFPYFLYCLFQAHKRLIQLNKQGFISEYLKTTTGS